MAAPGRRVLVVANDACPCPALVDAVDHCAAGGEVHVVAPALNGRLRHWMSDIDGALAAAGHRLDSVLQALRGRGLQVTAEVGDSDPLVAIDDALVQFPADVLVLAPRSARDAGWLERDLAGRACKRLSLPVVDVAADDTRATPEICDDVGAVQRVPATGTTRTPCQNATWSLIRAAAGDGLG